MRITDDRYTRDRLRLDLALRLIRHEAGALSAQRVRSKGTNDFVTDVDERSQALILSHISAAFPDHAVLAEEDAAADVRPAAASACLPRFRGLH